jgi:hypothetical protein
MPDRRRHRGPHPGDAVLFDRPDNVRKLRRAAGELAWLLGRQYARQAALTLVGNRYQFTQRQRLALARAVTAPAVARARRRRHVSPTRLVGARMRIDALNQIITIEAALAGGVLLLGHDGALRDLASVHGTYRLVQETTATLEAIGIWLATHGVRDVEFLLDAVVSNSGRLAGCIRALAEARGWPWRATLVTSADAMLQHTTDVVATSDSAILDRAERWFDLAATVARRIAPDAWYLDLDVPPPIVG